MKRSFAAVLFMALLLLVHTSVFADAVQSDDINYDFSDYEISQEIFYPDLMILIVLPENMLPFTGQNEGYYYSNEDGSHAFVIYESNITSLEEAQNSESIFGSDLTAYSLRINGLNAVDYWYFSTEGERELYCVRAFVDNGYGQILEFFEVSTDKADQGELEDHIMGVLTDDVAEPGTAVHTADEEEAVPGETIGDETGEAPIEIETEENALENSETLLTEETQALPEKTEQAVVGTGICTGHQVNVRVEPRQNARSIGRLNAGDGLTVLEVDGDWSLILCTLGQGYVKNQYIQLNEAQ